MAKHFDLDKISKLYFVGIGPESWLVLIPLSFPVQALQPGELVRAALISGEGRVIALA
jgi:hypothetical protein